MCVSGGGEPEHVRVNIVNHEIWPPQCDCRVCKKKPSAPIHMSIKKSCVTHTCAHTRFSTCSRDPGFLFFFLRSFSLREEMLPTRHRSYALAWPVPACAPSGWTPPRLATQHSLPGALCPTRMPSPLLSSSPHPAQWQASPPLAPSPAAARFRTDSLCQFRQSHFAGCTYTQVPCFVYRNVSTTSPRTINRNG